MKTKNGNITSVTVIGRRWFAKRYGNTYHTAQVLINGVSVHKSEEQYGYGQQYEQTAGMWLEANGYMPGRKPNQPLWQYFRDDKKVAWSSQAIDVGREKDL